MGIFSESKKKEKLFLLFDIGSFSVGGALFNVRNSSIPEVVFSVRENINFGQKLNAEDFFEHTLSALEMATSRIHLSGLGRPDKVFCVLSSPWYISQTRFIKIEKNTPFVFTEKLADELIQKEIGVLEEENKKRLEKEGEKLRPIEFKSMKTFLNGYSISSPFNKQARIVEMPAFISMGSEKTLRRIEQTIARHFHGEPARNAFGTADAGGPMKFISFAMAQFAVARDVWQDKENFLLVDIAGEVTDVSIVKKGILHNSVSYPLGRNAVPRRVAEELGFTISEAESVVSLYREGHADKSLQKKLAPFIQETENEWLRSFQQSLIKISNDISVPADIMVAVDKEFEEFFANTIGTEQFSQYTLTESKFHVLLMNTESLHGFVSFKDGVKRDPFTIIESLYITRHLSNLV